MMRAMKRCRASGSLRFLTLLSLSLCAVIATARAKDYTLIDALPKRVTAALIAGHKGWDTGNTGAMVAATYQYNDILLGMISDLSKAYYPKDSVSKKDTEEYLKALYTVRQFGQTVSPTDTDEGSLGRLNVPSEVTDDLQATITKMVRSITTEDPSFSYAEWQKQWEEALKKGNK